MNKVIKKLTVNFVRDGNQPPTLPPASRGQPAPHGQPLLERMKDEGRRMKTMRRILVASLSAIALATADGCKTPVEVTADYGVPGTNITASVDIGTNAVTVGGNYQAGTTNFGGTVTVGK
jgi:hypothetical protein